MPVRRLSLSRKNREQIKAVIKVTTDQIRITSNKLLKGEFIMSILD